MDLLFAMSHKCTTVPLAAARHTTSRRSACNPCHRAHVTHGRSRRRRHSWPLTPDSAPRADARLWREPQPALQLPSGLEEYCLSQVPRLWEVTPEAATRSLRHLQLRGGDRLDAARLATMTALRSLRAHTPDVPTAMAEAVPAVMGLTRLAFTADGELSGPAHDIYGRTLQAHVMCRLMQHLAALPSLRHLELGGRALEAVQEFEGGIGRGVNSCELVLPMVEVLVLNVIVRVDGGFIAFLHKQSRLASIHASQLFFGGPRDDKFNKQLYHKQFPSYVNVTTQGWG